MLDLRLQLWILPIVWGSVISNPDTWGTDNFMDKVWGPSNHIKAGTFSIDVNGADANNGNITGNITYDTPLENGYKD